MPSMVQQRLITHSAHLVSQAEDAWCVADVCLVQALWIVVGQHLHDTSAQNSSVSTGPLDLLQQKSCCSQLLLNLSNRCLCPPIAFYCHTSAQHSAVSTGGQQAQHAATSCTSSTTSCSAFQPDTAVHCPDFKPAGACSLSCSSSLA
jgi:hypothetical protein